MRNNKPLLRLAAALCGLFLLCSYCSRSDVITGAGGSVVEDMDSTLTNLGRGFVRINLGANAIDAEFSLPNGADSIFSTQFSGSLLFGVSKDGGDTAVAHIQYGVKPFAAGGTSALYDSSSSSPLGAFIRFLAADDDSLGVSDSISLFQSDTLPGLAPVNRADKQQVCENDGGCADNRIGRFVLGNGSDSIPLSPTLAQRIFDTRVSGDTSDIAAFAFSIVDYHGAMRKARPYIVVHVTKKDKSGKDVDVWDTIPGGLARFTAFENSAMAEARSLLPYSSQLTKRTAVFRVKLSGSLMTSNLAGDTIWSRGLLDTLGYIWQSSISFELLNAVAAIEHIPYKSPNSESAPDQEGDAAVFSGLIGNYKVVFLDTLVKDEIILGLDSATLAGKHLLYNEFAKTGSTEPTTPYNTHSFKGALRSALDRYENDETVDSYIYIYLRPVAENSAILWEKPPKIETVFTPSRSQ